MGVAPSSLSQFFLFPVLVSVALLVAVFFWGGTGAFVTAILLAFLEISLSFDNAVVNAKVLERMSPLWQRRFLTWGILSAVFLVRIILPICVVAVSAAISPFEVAHLALFDSARYAELLEHSRAIIYAFGATFLTLVGLKYFFDEGKRIHWVRFVEERLSRLGHIESIEVALVLGLLLITAFVDHETGLQVLMAGIVGVVLFILIRGITGMFATETSGEKSGAALFVYLNVLDAAFSLDSVVGAFALSTQIVVIMAGLGIGAYFVRALTIYLVHHGTLNKLTYIEHGAHWAIIGLAGTMYASLFFEVPEPITGFLGFSLILLAYWSSVRNHPLQPVVRSE